MTEDELERFNAIAYNYRAWPGHDPAGVLARFDELKAFVEEMFCDREAAEMESSE